MIEAFGSLVKKEKNRIGALTRAFSADPWKKRFVSTVSTLTAQNKSNSKNIRKHKRPILNWEQLLIDLYRNLVDKERAFSQRNENSPYHDPWDRAAIKGYNNIRIYYKQRGLQVLKKNAFIWDKNTIKWRRFLENAYSSIIATSIRKSDPWNKLLFNSRVYIVKAERKKNSEKKANPKIYNWKRSLDQKYKSLVRAPKRAKKGWMYLIEKSHISLKIRAKME